MADSSDASSSRRLLDARQMERAVRRMAGEIVERNQGSADAFLHTEAALTYVSCWNANEALIPTLTDDKTVILCDDVLFTGRTVRAALDALVDYGRPKAVRLAVLVDRVHRELPIQADFVGTTVQTLDDDVVKVAFEETDGRQEVMLLHGFRAGRGAP